MSSVNEHITDPGVDQPPRTLNDPEVVVVVGVAERRISSWQFKPLYL